MPPLRTYRTSTFSRERNRMHARKTRQRKKEHMQKLQNRADELKLEQIRLRQVIHEKNTASILVGLFQSDAAAISSGGGGETSDPRVDALLKRRVEDIPDASKIPELPALILPGQHSHGKKKNDAETTTNAATKNDSSNSNSNTTNEHPEEEDGIDYALLGKDRSSCSPAELDKIRRERNRMHAKRTRDRKRIFMEEMEVMIRQLEEENGVLTGHLERMEGTCSGAESSASVGVGAVSSSSSLLQTVSPDFGPVDCPLAAPASAPLAPESHYSYTAATATAAETSASSHPSAPPPQASDTDTSSRGDFLHQINSLLAAAGAFEKRPGSDNINAISCAESDVTASTNNSEHNSLSGEEEEAEEPIGKKRRLEEVLPEMEGNDVPSSVPLSITTTTLL